MTQAELSGKFDEARQTTGERLDALSKRLGDGLTESTEKTGKTLKELHERLAVFAASQKSVTDLSEQLVGQMAGLQNILSNKQARGAFGEVRLQDLVQDCLPAANFELQATLSNGKIVDCLLKLPNPPGSISVDAKFPLESIPRTPGGHGRQREKTRCRCFPNRRAESREGYRGKVRDPW